LEFIEDEASEHFDYLSTGLQCEQPPCSGDRFAANYPLHVPTTDGSNPLLGEVVGRHLNTADFVPGGDGIWSSVFMLADGNIQAQGSTGLVDSIIGGQDAYSCAGGQAEYYDDDEGYHHVVLTVCGTGCGH